jgi:DNA-directed RNA polymerase specialized sigma24 family protein
MDKPTADRERRLARPDAAVIGTATPRPPDDPAATPCRVPEQGSGTSSAVSRPPMPAPLLPGQAVTTAEQAWLDDRARAARAGDAAARHDLWLALQPRMDRWARTSLYRWGGASGPRRDSTPWLLDDLRQEGYPVLLQVLASWPGEYGFLPYLLAVAPRRMAGAWSRLREQRPLTTMRPLPDLADGSAAAEEALALLAALAADLGGADGALLLAHIADGRSLAAAGRSVGLGRRETQRRWERIRLRLREGELAGRAAGVPDDAPRV